MIVRESPKSKGRESNALLYDYTDRTTVKTNQPNWPPQSSVEALLSSPSGRKKFERQRERTSVSPSPSKRRPVPRELPGGDDEEEDEETLQLQLQAIEAKLKLKKLQQAKKAAAAEDTDSDGISSRTSTAGGLGKVELPRRDTDVQVPHSPIRVRRAPEEPKSPARVLLGIDKGLTARDVSLKRPGSGLNGGLARTSSSRAAEPPKIKSFSERIAESRSKEKEREEKETRLEGRRSRGFGLHSIEGLKDLPTSRTGSAMSSGTRGSQDMPPPLSKGLSRAQNRSTTDLRNPPTPRPGLSRASHSDNSFSSKSSATSTASKYAEIISRDDSAEASSFESFSGLHLKKRSMQHNVIARTLEGKTVLTLPQLLKTVKAPEYDPPDWENDYVVLGVICHKSTPYQTQNAGRDQTKSNMERDADPKGNFMVLRLTDFKWELDLFLFDTGFSQFWKLPLGTLVAVLNPDIMKPRKIDSGKFSLKLSSSDDTILELGVARDLDFCHAHKKDGKQCDSWIDSRKTEVCEFHLGLQMEKSKKGRMEVNTMTGFGRGPGGGGGKFGMFGRGRGGTKDDEPRREGKYHDRGLHETMFIAPRPGGTARAIDRDEQSWERGASREERYRKQLAEKEKERELAKRLGSMGDGTTGGDYLKLKGADTPNLPARGYTSSQDPKVAKPDKPDTDFSSLLNRTSADVSMAPTKRKRIASGKSTASSEPVGWGKAFKYGRIPSPKKDIESALRGTREPSPAKKRARLLLPEKGIREPGRDSLGGLDIGLIAAMEEDDDDLEII
jgi:minichromosome maintenance protein 10